MRVFFLHRALEAILDQNECGFLQKNNCLGYEPEKKINLGEKNHFWGPGRPFFCDPRSFAKNKDRSPKIRITYENSLTNFGQYHGGICHTLNRFIRQFQMKAFIKFDHYTLSYIDQV